MDRRTLRRWLAELAAAGKAHDAREHDKSKQLLNITPETGQLLAILVRAMSARRILEVGTSNGYSTIWLAWPDARQALVEPLEAFANGQRPDAIQSPAMPSRPPGKVEDLRASRPRRVRQPAVLPSRPCITLASSTGWGLARRRSSSATPPGARAPASATNRMPPSRFEPPCGVVSLNARPSTPAPPPVTCYRYTL